MPNVAPRQPEINPTAQGDDVGDVADLLVGFDPQRYPIIARHVLGIGQSHSAGRAAAALVADLRFRNKMAVLLAMGDRPATEMVAELAVVHGLEVVVDQLLDRYLAVPDESLDITNGRDFPSPPLHEVGR